MASLADDIYPTVRRRLGWPDADAFVTDEELRKYAAESLDELWHLLATVHGPDWAWTEHTITTVKGTPSYGVTVTRPGRIIRIDCKLGSRRIPLIRGTPGTHVFAPDGIGWMQARSITYFLNVLKDNVQWNIHFDPVPQAAHTVKLWIQEKFVLPSDGDELLFDHVEYLILDMMIKCREKEESDTSSLVAQKAAYEARLKAMATPIDASAPRVIADARGIGGEDEYSVWWRR